jgi:uncharacterized protein (TIGR03067 family)
MATPLVGYLLLLSAGAAPLNAAALKELKALEGDWVVERIEANGKKHEPDDGKEWKLTIKGTKWTSALTGEKGEVVALDPSCTPRLIDLKSVPPTDRPAFIREGIYKLNGDTLTIALYQGKDKKRPTSFETPSEAGTVVFVLKRVKR